ncbi:MAG: hypothetical protein H6815_09400 [Phycisphaeraceae bacterium]|nr:hypothetical protein [Phycisphaerales bacterium]MCB9860653.1 hypothetical protein [Phycisphaeraceae bacterium]
MTSARTAAVLGVLICAGTAIAQRGIDPWLDAVKNQTSLPAGVKIEVGTVPGTIDARAAAMTLCSAVTWSDVDTSTDLPMITVTKRSASGATKPTVLVVAGADGRHELGQIVAIEVARSIAINHADALDAVDVVVIPCIDTEISTLMSGNWVRADAKATRLVAWSNDEDGDGRKDEDGPNDLNGDGIITMMRVANPPPRMDREWIIDPDDPRIMRKPKKDEGEIATHAMIIESTDDDGDGEYAEDATGSMIVDTQFPHLWPEFSEGAGRFPLDYPSANALARYIESNRNIAAVVVYGPRDTVTKIPDAGKFDVSGRVPTGIERGDEDLYKAVSKSFGEITHIKSTHDAIEKGFGEGSFAGWTYAHMGIPTFATPVWVRSDLLETKKDDKADKAEDEAELPTNVTIGGRSFDLTEEGIASLVQWMDTLSESDGFKPALDLMHLESAIREKIASLTPDAVAARKEAEAEKEKKKKKDDTEGESAGDTTEASVVETKEAPKPKFESVSIAGRTIELSTEGIQTAMGELDGMSEAERNAIMQEFMALPEPVRQKFMTVGQGGTIEEPQPEAPAKEAKPAAKKDSKDDKKKTEDEKWFEYLDEHASDDGSIRGFVEWTTFEHPTLGTVEIGGMVPGVFFNPAVSDGADHALLMAKLVDQQAEFIAKLASMMPKVTIEAPIVEDLGNGIWRIDLRIVNTGEMDTTSAIGNKTQRYTRTMVRIDLPKERILSGNRASGFASLDAMGGDWSGSWVVNANGMSSVKITIDGPAVVATELNVQPTRTGGAR